MSDVIFSGSSARKPVATATVELTFDNSDGRAGGEYAKYAEIAVKRQVTRDGQSAYFLNGTRCRRKDITDLFLGTGLGPRSYAIIEQGMISQIVEARPEELRGFLEEAAGVSLYKERRRETENRIRHTRENLERLADLREEVGKQLAKLKRQARAAERYRELKDRYRGDEARLTALRWRKARSASERQAAELNRTRTRLEEVMASQREAEKALEALREKQHKASERTSGIQAELYEVGGEIARLEQSIEHQQELRQRREAEHRETESQLDELKQHLVLDRTQVEEVTGRIGELEPALNRAREEETQAREALERAEADLAERQDALSARQREASKSRQQVELLKLRIEHLDERMNQAAQRLEDLKRSGEGQRESLDAEMRDTGRELEAASGELERAERALSDAESKRSGLEEAVSEARGELERLRAEQSEAQGRLESLNVLNRPAESEDAMEEWLAEHGLAERPTLLETLEVEDRWQRAAETVLSRWLGARVVDEALPLDPPDGELGMVRAEATRADGGTLADHVRGAGALNGILGRVRCAASREEAARARTTLADGESVITPDGLWMGPGWLWQPGAADGEESRLARQQRIRALEEAVAERSKKIEKTEARIAALREELDGAVEGRDRARAEVDRKRARRAELSGVRAGQQNRLEALDRQHKAREQERASLAERQEADRDAVSEVRREMQQALEQLERLDGEERELGQRAEAARGERERAREAFREVRGRREELALKLESGRASLNSLKQAIARMDTQISQLQSRYVELSEALAQGDEPVREQRAQRDALLKQRLEIEKRLGEARGELEGLEAEWRDRDRARQKAGAEAENIREQVSTGQVRQRETDIEVERLAARVSELDGDLEALVEELPEDAEAEAWVQELDRLEEQIRRLEPVNLAAIQEAEQEAERKEYLDRQHQDLTEALETLEQAIDRIDRTTRTRFKDTFERVKTNMETLFPRLFGGGHAHLELVGDDWLTAGAAIMARPPGKRISRIHLLSGGEKALTAVAFVFAIFNLNPAPFCLLDEVDAPLDDANVGRFSDLVREMSERVQFLFVTHNKVTMEVAHQMLGVTMREPGISRLVSVDLEKAVEMAAS